MRATGIDHSQPFSRPLRAIAHRIEEVRLVSFDGLSSSSFVVQGLKGLRDYIQVLG